MPHSFGKLVTPQEYRAVYDPLTGFESVCSLARQRRNLEFLATARPRHILEVGCGAMILAAMARGMDLGFASWTIVEPEPDFTAAARSSLGDDARFAVVEGYLEASEAALRQRAPGGFDAVLIAGLLHETSAPKALLAAAMALTAPGGQVLASVPNAGSFHRLLAVQAGLIPRPDTLSPRDRALGHPVVFEAETLLALLSEAGLTGLALDGYLFKPLTNAQMEAVLASTDPGLQTALIDGLISLGRQFPAQAAEICAIGRKPR
jgi:SAM-dependent methyltransferase